MTKNITVGIPDELAKRMDELTEVNWSAVTRDCIEQYIKQRKAENLEKIIEKVKQKRGNDFKKGYEFIVTNIERLGLPELEEIVYPDEEKHADRLYEFLSLSRNTATRMLLRQLIGYTEDEETGEVSDIHFIVSSDFIEGMREAAKEIYEKSK